MSVVSHNPLSDQDAHLIEEFMNKKYMIKIPLKHPENLEYAKNNLQFSVNTLLHPFYIAETSLLSMFVEEEEYEKYGDKAREIIYNASLRALEFTYNKLNTFPEEHKLIFRRELALCLAMNNFANHFYKGFTDTIQRSKSFADFSVSTTVKNNPSLLKEMIAGSSNCILEAKLAITNASHIANSLGLTSVKGVYNASNSFSYRTWIHTNLPIESSSVIANGKIWFEGNLYKDSTRVSNTGIRYSPRGL